MSGGECTISSENFLELIQQVFDHSPEGKEVGAQLLMLRHDNQSASEFALMFRTLAAASSWNKPAFKPVYHQELKQDILMELACTANLEKLTPST